MILSEPQKYKLAIYTTFAFYPIWGYVLFFVFDKLLLIGILPIAYVSILGGKLISEYWRMKDRNWKPDPQVYDHDGKKV